MKTLKTTIKLTLLLLVFLQVRILKSVMFWKPMPEFNTWLHYIDENGKNELIMPDLAGLIVFYVHAALVTAGIILFGSFWLSLTGIIALQLTLYFVKRNRHRKDVHV